MSGAPPPDGTIRQSEGDGEDSRALSLPKDADQHPDAPRLEGYLLTAPLGRGAFAQVWRAYQLRTRRWVAVKVFIDQEGCDWSLLAAEAERLVRLDKHPGVVALLDADLAGKTPFFAMELMEGGSLEARAAAVERPGAAAVAAWLEDMARALAFVHAKGVIHCDLKPANALLDGEGRVRLADFGQARAVSRATGALGTMFYMAPEQAAVSASGAPPAPDQRWDLYALGATAYAVLTGRPPFWTESSGTTASTGALETRLSAYRDAVRDGDAAAGALAGLSAADEDLAAIVRRCLRSDPAARYQSAAELLADLDARRSGRPVSGLAGDRAYGARKFVLRNLAAVVVGALAAAGLALAAGQIVRERASLRRQLAVSHLIRAQQAAETGASATAALYAAESDRLDPTRAARANALAYLSSIATPRAVIAGHLAVAAPGARFVLVTDGVMARVHGTDGSPAGAPFSLASPVTAAALSADGTRALLGGADGVARLFDARAGVPLGAPLPHAGKVVSARLSADGRWAATGSEDGFSRLWSAEDGRPAGAPLDLGDHVHGVSFSPDSRALYSVTEEGRFGRLSRVPGGEPFGAATRHEGKIYSSDFSADGKTLLTSASDGTARLWRARDGAPAGVPMRHAGRILKAAFSGDGARVVTGSWDETARVWDARTGAPVTPPLRHEGLLRDQGFCADGSAVVTASEDHAARLWDARTGVRLGREMRHPGVVSRAACVDGAVVTQSGDRVYFWPVDRTLPADSAVAPAARVAQPLPATADGAYFVASGPGPRAVLWDARAKKPVGKPMEHDGAVNAAAVAPDGTWLATAGDDHAVRLWTLPGTLRLTEITLRHPGRVLAVAVSPDSRRVLSGDETGGARLWDAKTGVAGRLMRGDGAVTAVAFSPDGRTLVTAGRGGTARLWDAETGMSLGPPLRLGAPAASARFVDGGAAIVVLGRDGGGRRWPLSWLKGEASARELAAEAQAASVRFVDSDGEVKLLDLGRWRALRSQVR